MIYPEALDYLYGFINYRLTRQERYQAHRMTLMRSQQLMLSLDEPQLAYPTLHLTGTKGKGSVGAMLASILKQAGYRVGLYSSPHLQDFRERIRINDQMIEPQDLADLVAELSPKLEVVTQLTWFEAVTAIAFEYFRRQSVDIAIIEVGMGGRLDATNVVKPLVSTITSLSFDHMSLLGETLPQIAYEKAGIIKPQVPVVSAPQNPTALAVLERTARQRNAPLTLIGRDWNFQIEPSDLVTERWQAAPTGGTMQPYQTPLLGHHQAINGTVAIATLHQLGWSIPEAAMQSGLSEVNWAGRMEIIQETPWVILDAAHNAASATCLAQTIQERLPTSPKVVVFAAKSDKDIAGMLQALHPITDHLIVTLAIDSRAEAPEAIQQLARQLGYTQPIEVIPDVPLALEMAQNIAGQVGMICVTGSLYLVGEVRTLVGLEVGQAVKRHVQS